MAKALTKKLGRPPAEIANYFTKIQPHLALGFSLHRSCKIAQIPYTTVVDYYKADESFRREIDALKDDTNLHARAKLVGRVKGSKYDHKAVMDWLTNMDEDFKQTGQVTNVQVNLPILGKEAAE